jgi:hypothetical protein
VLHFLPNPACPTSSRTGTRSPTQDDTPVLRLDEAAQRFDHTRLSRRCPLVSDSLQIYRMYARIGHRKTKGCLLTDHSKTHHLVFIRALEMLVLPIGVDVQSRESTISYRTPRAKRLVTLTSSQSYRLGVRYPNTRSESCNLSIGSASARPTLKVFDSVANNTRWLSFAKLFTLH